MKNIITISTLCLLTLLFCGCFGSGSSAPDAPPVKGELPKLRFHKPKEFGVAIERLQEAHKIIVSEDAIPAPKAFKILEVVHGTGSSAHSHYYLAGGEIEEEDDHENVMTTEFTHDLEVDLFTEIYDVSKWLPDIAGDTEMAEADWNQVKKGSESLVDHMFGTQNDALSSDEKRAAYQKEADKIEAILDNLSKLSAKIPPSEDSKND